MKVLVTGATGMVGQGVLLECLRDPRVERVLSLGRSPTGRTDPKLEELVQPDLTDLAQVEDRLRGYDACFFCLGVSSAGMSEVDYRKVTFDLTTSVAQTLVRLNPAMSFVYVSGAGTDSTEHGRAMWARVKGQTENALLRLPFRGAYMFRPGVIRAKDGIRSRSRIYRVLYAVLLPFVLVAAAISPDSMTTTESMGRAMIRVAAHGAPTHLLGTREINRLAKAP
ncbi:MAG: NAD-dependent epimerase/dehydratase family protein [Thermoplasmata archaeon]|nr:NAD-dependent epimerase/dehydratase family protein [Thermoplasmata archaeon]